MKRRNAEKLKDIILRFLRQEGLETPLNEHRAVASWNEIAGPAVAKMTSSIQMRNSTMFVKITKPALRQDLMMRRTQLARRINEKVGAQVVSQIVFY